MYQYDLRKGLGVYIQEICFLNTKQNNTSIGIQSIGLDGRKLISKMRRVCIGYWSLNRIERKTVYSVLSVTPYVSTVP